MNTLFLLLILFFASRKVKDKTACRCIYLLMALLAFNYLYDGYCNFEDPGAGYMLKVPEATCENNPSWETSDNGTTLGPFVSDPTATTIEKRKVSCRTRITGVPESQQGSACMGASKTTGEGLSVSECIFTSPTCDKHTNRDDCNAEDGCIYVDSSVASDPTCTGTNDGSGSPATCTGDNDGTGTACALNADQTACAVIGGNCSFTESTGDACALNSERTGCAVDGGDCTYTPASAATDATCRPLVPEQDRVSPDHLEMSYKCAPGYEGTPMLMARESVSGSGSGAPWNEIAENYGSKEREEYCSTGNYDKALLTLGGCNLPTENETCHAAKVRLEGSGVSDACGQVGWKYDSGDADIPAGSRLVAGDLNSMKCGSELCDIASGEGRDSKLCCKEQMPCYINERVNPNQGCSGNSGGEMVPVSPPTGFSIESPYGLESVGPTMSDWGILNNQLCSGTTCDLSEVGNQGILKNDRDKCCQKSISCDEDILSDDYFDNLNKENNFEVIKTLLNTRDLCGGPGTMEEMKDRAKEAVKGIKAAAGEDADLSDYCDTFHSYDDDTGQCCLIGTYGTLGCGGPTLKP